MTEHFALTTASRRPVADSENSLQNRERAPERLAYPEESAAYRVQTGTNSLTRYAKMTALSQLCRKTEAFLWSAVGPLLVVAAVGLVGITLSDLPPPDRPASLAGPLSGHSLLHFPR